MKDRLRYFSTFMRQAQGENFKIQDPTVQDGREFLRELMSREVKYWDHPMMKQVKAS